MKIELIPEEGNWYKVNFHCHTDISDGTMTPQEVKRHYQSLGYHAVCFTDHEVLVPHTDLCDPSFVALHGYEVAVKQDEDKHTGLFMPVYHFNMIAKDQATRIMPRCYRRNRSFPGNAGFWMEKLKPFREDDLITETHYEKEQLNRYLCAVRDAGFLITYNHPQWSLHSAADYIGLEGLHAVEAINGGCIVLNDNTSLPYEQMLRSGMSLIPTGGDDNHTLEGCGLAWTMVKAPRLTYDALITAYENGNCYASEAPELLSLILEDGELIARVRRTASVTLFSEGRYFRHTAVPNGEDTSELRIPYTPASYGRYFRLELKDASGRRAFSRAYAPQAIAERM